MLRTNTAVPTTRHLPPHQRSTRYELASSNEKQNTSAIVQKEDRETNAMPRRVGGLPHSFRNSVSVDRWRGHLKAANKQKPSHTADPSIQSPLPLHTRVGLEPRPYTATHNAQYVAAGLPIMPDLCAKFMGALNRAKSSVTREIVKQCRRC